MSDKQMTTTPVGLYFQLLGPMRDTARALGYALAVHGSCIRDLDLVAVPWVETCATPEELVKALCSCVEGYVPTVEQGAKWHPGAYSVKPHRQIAVNICFGGYPFIDLRIMPVCH